MRGIIPAGDDLSSLVQEDAEARLWSPEAVQRMLASEQEHDMLENIINAMTVDEMNGGEPIGAPDGIAPPVEDSDDDAAARLRDEMASARRTQPPPPPPDLRLLDGSVLQPLTPPAEGATATAGCYSGTSVPIVEWHRPNQRVQRLTEGQVQALLLLVHAGAKHLTSFLSGEGGVGKSTLVQLLVQWWRSQGYRVIVLGSSAKAARLVGGHTVHSACLLDSSGGFDVARLDGTQGSDRFIWLATADIIIIDEISMLTTSALNGVNFALNYIMSRATGRRTTLFGSKSVIAVGDLYQLPAVEKGGREQQVFQGVLWSQFKLVELHEIVRVDPTEYRFAQLLSRARTAWRGTAADGTPHEIYRAEDEALLRSRVCQAHGTQDELVRFRDVQRVRPPGGRRQHEQELSQTVCHCPMTTGASVLASRCAKVNELNDAFIREQQQARQHTAAPPPPPPPPQGATAAAVATAARAALAAARAQLHPAAPNNDGWCRSNATDTLQTTGEVVHSDQIRSAVDSKLSGMLRRLHLHVGQQVLITVNKRTIHSDFANAVLATIVNIQKNPVTGQVAVVFVRPQEWGDIHRAPLAIHPHRAECKTHGRVIVRQQFPLIPAHAMTVSASHKSNPNGRM